MSDIGGALKQEITRLAKKTLRSEVAAIHRQTSNHRKTLAALRKQVAAGEARIRQLERQLLKRKGEESNPSSEPTPAIRYRKDTVKVLRERLALSARELGILVGVSEQTVYNWESGAQPRSAQLAKLAELRGIGRREAKARVAKHAA
ncbi:MAG: helix-turn-helix domain-containing protein [Sinobacteraceae bacterium]|nr:helix-turn-helix domain-containing protein [Nevskiaceae bacterium]